MPEGESITAMEVDPNADRLEKLASASTDASSVQQISVVDQEVERISHYQDMAPLVPGTLSWGVHAMRSPTLDDMDEFISDRSLGLISNASLPGKDKNTTWDVELKGNKIESVTPHDPSRMPPELTNSINADSALLAPSLCHPHVHIDKAFLLSHPRYAHLQIEKGDFDEAMELTSQAKANFTQNDIIERGQRLVDESIAAGVAHMRVFVELDKVVDTKCLDAILILKRRVERRSRIHIQICAFAQLPLFSTAQQDTDGQHIRKLIECAARSPEIEALGSTPYVESNEQKMQQNIDWITALAIEHRKHLDFHLDYNLDADTKPMVWHVIKTLKSANWRSKNAGRMIMLGHCTRLTLFDAAQWEGLSKELGDLPITFVGLPTSDLFMMRTGNGARGTLDIPKLIKDCNLNACIGMNNIGNAFTPQGSCDPLSLASAGIGIYQAGTEVDAELLYQCISTRAKNAIGLGSVDAEGKELGSDLLVQAGGPADLLLFGSDPLSRWRTRHSISEAVYLYDGAVGRRLCAQGVLVSE